MEFVRSPTAPPISAIRPSPNTKAAQRCATCRFRRPQVRHHERRDVGRPASHLEALRRCPTASAPRRAVLDLASGTGDLIRLMSREVGSKRALCCTPTSTPRCWKSAATIARSKCGGADGANATPESLPFADKSFDAVTIAFGLPATSPQGSRAGRDASGAEGRWRARWCSSSRDRTRC